jgi:excisionase family DNA binding protein
MMYDIRQISSENRMSIGEAAQQYGVSRRTIERWIHDKRLVAVPSADDGRKRLVDPETVQALVEQRPRRTTRRKSPSAGNESDPTVEDQNQLPTEAPPAGIGSFQAIDEVLLQAYNYQQSLIRSLHPESRQELTLKDLREGPLGWDLRWIAALARGEVSQPRERILSAIDMVLQVLFWPPGAEDYTVPRSFWDTPTGKMLSRAKLRAYRQSELVSIGGAAQMLGVTVPTVYRWMDDRTLSFVRDDVNGRTFIVRHDVDNVRRVALELLGQDALQGRSLAS